MSTAHSTQANQSSDQMLLREDRQGVAYLTLNRPEAYNALSLPLMRTLEKSLQDIARDKSIGCVVLAGSGRGFCAGHDLKELSADDNLARKRGIFDQCSRLMLSIVELRQPIIAKVHGVATAAGCQLVASCDLAIATDSTKFGTPGVNIGLFCSTPMVALSRAVGRKQAMRMLLSGDLIDAQTAVSFGLINEAVSPEALDQRVNDLANEIARKSRRVLATGKQAFYRQIEMDMAMAYEYCSEVMTQNMTYEDAEEGIGAFLEKRDPVWKHA